MAGATGTDADPFRAADRRGGGYSMVIQGEAIKRRRRFKGLAPLDQRLARGGPAPSKRSHGRPTGY